MSGSALNGLTLGEAALGDGDASLPLVLDFTTVGVLLDVQLTAGGVRRAATATIAPPPPPFFVPPDPGGSSPRVPVWDDGTAWDDGSLWQ